MNGEQALLLQRAVQWAIDEVEADLDGSRSGSPLQWNQEVWAQGVSRVGGSARTQTMELYGERVMVDVTEAECQTACCIAGNIVITAGDRVVSAFLTGSEIANSPFRTDRRRNITLTHAVVGGDSLVNIANRAADLLGLDWPDVELLFSASNDIEDVVRYAVDIADDFGQALVLRIPDIVVEEYPGLDAMRERVAP